MPAKKKDLTAVVKEAEEVVMETVQKAETKTAAASKRAKAVAKKTEETVKDTAVATKVAAKKTAAKAAAKTAAVAPVSVLQFQGKEVDLTEVYDRVKAAFVAEGHKASTIKTVKTYVKPEENAAYYVINDKFSGRVDLF